MLRSLLIPLDGSECSARVVKAAIAVARGRGLSLAGIGVVDKAEICKPEPVPMGAQAFKEERDRARLEEARGAVAGFLAAFESECAAAGVAARTLQREGRASDEIELEARNHDLVVLSRETHLHFETRDQERDVLLELAREAGRPILALPPGGAEPGDGGVLIAYDDSLPAARAVQLFQLSGLGHDARVTVLGIAGDEGEAARRCARAVGFLRTHGREVRALPVVSGSPAREILERVAAIRPGLLVMGSFGHTGLKERLFGSVTRSILDPKSGCAAPVFLYH